MDRRLEWIDAKTFEVGGMRFHLDLSRERPVSSDRLVLMKDRPLLNCYQDLLVGLQASRVLELGIWGGGSTILLERLLSPRKLVAIDRVEERVQILDNYITSHGLQDTISCHYGVWQSQTHKIGEIVDREFGTNSIDLVIDDASHMLEPTRTSFNCLFPRLKAGGLYIVEDWAWAHWPGPYQQGEWLTREPLSDLVFDAVLVVASEREIISSVRVEPGLVAITKGPATVSADFDITKAYRSRGKRLAWV